MLLSRQQVARSSLAIITPKRRCYSITLASAATQTQPAVPRRALGAALLGAVALPLLSSGAAHAGFKKELKKKKIPEEDYVTLPANGLRVYDMEEGSGPEVKPGDRIVVHYDCLYRGLDVVSSRAARLLGGNRTIAEPYEFIVGEPVYAASLKSYDSDSANPLFAGSSGPKPPQALSLSVVGMKKGGKRSVIVDIPDLGYPNGVNELPPATTFELKVEVLNVYSKA
ncbi:hypothetical protein VOLCADRAFT_120818 [Volvox carteri f. nagariensis]|uniref:peptidylprolyl isomerase n=1 Tax=Volvox carteri f. nagariensis TaxID=3068 RepID=D8TU47_VOLCA|nr:uncharacterized protein VOLCADRAFT_120818 [Volvox carteri f. nagariensis]EFJ48977.1 hypothetical protein VOLCADRAFT_120818 [Volvox carteri f. nagariensis]|eukprot:XP_002949874.1 hypothetical protein VOLCADRAFT_120818 [Volvox carteri f. nagariensis]